MKTSFSETASLVINKPRKIVILYLHTTKRRCRKSEKLSYEIMDSGKAKRGSGVGENEKKMHIW